MIHKGRSVSIAIVLSLTVGLSVNPVTAEPISTSFTYQGQLKQGGVPVNDTCDIQLTLWDDLAAGIQVGPTLTFNGGTGNAPPVGVVNGLFHVELDFGGDAFAGDARWLQVAVCCTSPCATSFTTLSPRQPLTATPFALHTRGITSNETGYIGIGTNSPAYPLEVRTSSADAAIFGSNNTVVPVSPAPFSPEGAIAGGALGAGVYGESFAINGKGVQGEAHADTGNGVGLIGRSRADAGFGVFGIATKPTGFTVGVEGRSASIDGIGVHGVVSDPANVGSGVRGLNFSADGVGVLGENWGTSGGRAVGVEGNSDGVDGIGVVGLAKALTGIGVGVQGESDSIDGTGVVGTSKRKGVIGEASDTEDVTAFGVTGRAASPHGIGVLGEVSAETGFAIGVKGTTASDEGKGVEGKHESITGAGFGVVGSSLSPDAIGVAGYHFAETGTELVCLAKQNPMWKMRLGYWA